MATLKVKQVPDDTLRQLRDQAIEIGVSFDEHVIKILGDAARRAAAAFQVPDQPLDRDFLMNLRKKG